MVPKDLYGSCEHTDEDWGFDALYQRASVTKGSPHEVSYHGYCSLPTDSEQIMVRVNEEGSFIAWEFDVIIGEVLFCLLRAKSSDSTASATKVTMVIGPENYYEGEAIQVGQ